LQLSPDIVHLLASDIWLGVLLLLLLRKKRPSPRRSINWQNALSLIGTVRPRTRYPGADLILILLLRQLRFSTRHCVALSEKYIPFLNGLRR